MTLTHLFDKTFRDTHGKVVLFQAPNIPLGIWLVCTVGSHVLPDSVRTISSFIALMALICWAGMEIIGGVNWFRRGLGVVVLIAVLLNRL